MKDENDECCAERTFYYDLRCYFSAFWWHERSHPHMLEYRRFIAASASNETRFSKISTPSVNFFQLKCQKSLWNVRRGFFVTYESRRSQNLVKPSHAGLHLRSPAIQINFHLLSNDDKRSLVRLPSVMLTETLWPEIASSFYLRIFSILICLWLCSHPAATGKC